MSCSRQSSATDFGPRNDASTTSVFCCAVNFRYLRVSLNGSSRSIKQPSSDLSRTEHSPDPVPEKSDQKEIKELSTPRRGPRQTLTDQEEAPPPGAHRRRPE